MFEGWLLDWVVLRQGRTRRGRWSRGRHRWRVGGQVREPEEVERVRVVRTRWEPRNHVSPDETDLTRYIYTNTD